MRKLTLVLFLSLFSVASWGCRLCSFGECSSGEHGSLSCRSVCYASVEPYDWVCNCVGSGGLCTMVYPEWMGVVGSRPPVEATSKVTADLSKYANSVVVKATGKNDAMREVIRNALVKSHSDAVSDALSNALQELEANGELPRVIQFAKRTRDRTAASGWKVHSVETFAIKAQDRQLRESPIFEIEHLDSGTLGNANDIVKLGIVKDTYRFSFKDEQLHILPRALAR